MDFLYNYSNIKYAIENKLAYDIRLVSIYITGLLNQKRFDEANDLINLLIKEDNSYNIVKNVINNKQGYDIRIVSKFITGLLNQKKFDEANNIINMLIEENNPNYYGCLIFFLLYSYRAEECLEMVEKKNILHPADR